MTKKADADLFGQPLPDLFATAKERYGTWPITVWDVDHQDRTMQTLKNMVADTGEARAKGKAGTHYSNSRGAMSIFNPVVAIWALNMWGPKQGRVFDPFAGGGTRAITVAKRGLDYVGVELREEECHAVRARCHANGISCALRDRDGYPVAHGLVGDERQANTGSVTLINADARRTFRFLETESFDFLLTCPPYWTLEQYSQDEADLSNATLTYGDFLLGMEAVVEETRRLLKPGARAVWVVGITRRADGNIVPLPADMARVHYRYGFSYREEVILAMRNTGAVVRVGTFEKGQRNLIRTHEYLLVFTRPGNFAPTLEAK